MTPPFWITLHLCVAYENSGSISRVSRLLRLLLSRRVPAFGLVSLRLATPPVHTMQVCATWHINLGDRLPQRFPTFASAAGDVDRLPVPPLRMRFDVTTTKRRSSSWRRAFISLLSAGKAVQLFPSLRLGTLRWQMRYLMVVPYRPRVRPSLRTGPFRCPDARGSYSRMRAGHFLGKTACLGIHGLRMTLPAAESEPPAAADTHRECELCMHPRSPRVVRTRIMSENFLALQPTLPCIIP